MADNDDYRNIDSRVGLLEQRMAEVVTALGGFSSTLTEIKNGISANKPTLWAVLPILLTFIGMVIAGVLSVSSIRTDMAHVIAREDAVERRLDRLTESHDKTRDLVLDEIVKERDYLKGLRRAEPAPRQAND